MRILKWLGVTLVVVVGLTIGLQSPWRPSGAMHVIATGSVSNALYAVFQRHNSAGFNSTYLVAQKGERWEWFSLGNDHPRWFSLKTTTNDTGAISFSKFGFLLGEFDPADYSLTAGGRKGYCQTETLDPPDQVLKKLKLPSFAARMAAEKDIPERP